MSLAEQASQLPWYGIHHVALVTEDLDATIGFYKEVLGMRVSPVFPSKAGRGRHCLISLTSDTDTICSFHFFERPTEKTTLGATDTYPSSLVPHVALRLSDGAAADALRERLSAANVPITEIPELGTFVFFDNNRLCLEVTWPRGEHVS